MPVTFEDLLLAEEQTDEKIEKVQDLIPYVTSTFDGLFVDTDGRSLLARVDDDPTYVWARSYGDGPPSPLKNNKRIPPFSGIPVWAGYLEDSQEREIIRVNYAALDTSIEVPFQDGHHEQHEEGGWDAINVSRRLRNELKTTVRSGLTVAVSSLEYDTYWGSRRFFSGLGSFDLTQYVPAAGVNVFVLVYLSKLTNTIQAEAGVSVIGPPTTVPPKPDTPLDGTASANVLLRGGVTSISDDDIFEARRFLGEAGGNSQSLQNAILRVRALSDLDLTIHMVGDLGT